MSKLITQIKRLALTLCLATPIVSRAASTYSTDYSVTGSETAYTSSAGNANVYWQNFNFRAAVDKDNLEHGYYFFLKDGDTDIGETDAAVKLDSITLTWGSTAGGGIGASDTPYLVVTTADDTPVIIGVSEAGGAFAANGTSTFSFSDVVLASNAKYRFYFYKNDVSSLSVGTVLTGAQQARINGRYHNTSGDARADYNDIRCGGGAGYSINCSFVVSPLEEGDAVVLETGDASIPLAAADTPVVVEGKVVDGAVDVGSEVAVDGVLTVCGEATTLVLTDSLTATAFYFPATVTIDASAVSGLDPTGDDSSKTTTLLSGALKYTTAPTVVLPAATAGMIYETNVTASGISVTVVKGVDCVETITANTVWSDIKPEGWIDSVVGDKPSIEITYEGEEPVTLTFDEDVTAGALTLTGNIVVEASAAATFGTVTAGAGSVVEMANMTITTQSGSGVYRYRSGYPSTVPNHGLTYEYVGTADSENPGTVNLNGMRGTVRTTGYMSITGYYPLNTAAKLDVVSGTTTLTAGGQAICGYITIREGATLVNTATDSLAYSSYASIIDIYGTLDMGTSRWTTWSGAAINLRGGEVVGVGEGNDGALDFMGTCNITAYADSTISGNVKFRNALSNVTVNDGVTLTISGATKPGYDGGGITKKGAGTLKFTSDPYVPGGIVVEAGTLAFDTESDVDPVVTYTAAVLKDANMGYVDASNWKGRIVISAVEAGTTSTQVALNKTGNENSYLTLSGVSGNAWCANDNYTVQPAITLAGDVNFENGYSSKTVTFRKIAAGSGNLSLKRWSSCTGITYGFTTLDADNYTGTIQLDGSVLTFNVGDILKANAQPGDKVLPLTVANNATVNLSGAKVNGEAADLEVKEDGIYIAVPVVKVTVTVPAVANTTVTVKVGEDTIGTAAGNYDVEPGSEVTVTYAAADGYQISGQTVYTIDTASATTFDPSETTQVAQIVAQIRTGATTYEYYTTLAGALASPNVAYGITLRANIDEDEITVSSYVRITGAYTISSDVKIVDGGQLQLMLVTMAGTLTIEENGIYATGGGTLNELVTKDGAKIQLTTLSDTAAPLAITTLSVEGNLTIISSWGSAVRDTYYKALSYVTANADIAEGATVDSVNEWSAKVEEEGDNTVVYLAITKIAVVDGVYYDDAQDAVDAAVTSGKPVSFLVAPGTVKLGAGETLVVSGAILPTVELDDGLATPPYEIERTIDGEKLTNTYTVKAYVAQITRSEYSQELGPHNVVYKYETVKAALEAAETGDTVVVLVNTHERVYAAVNNNVTLDINGKTMTSPVDDVIIQNGTGTLTIKDTATTPGLVQSTINGVDLGVAVWARQGTVVVQSGVFENNSNYEATLYVSNGAYARVEGGTFRNVAEGTYHWKQAWAPVTLNVQNGHADGAAAITVTGGNFTTNPANGDDSFGGTFVASGYAATEDAGVWTVSKKSGIDPTDQTSTQEVTPSEQEIADAGSAEAAAKNKATVTVPEAVATATGVTEETYKSYFTLSATETAPGSGVYEVAIVELNEDVVFPTSESDELTADLADVLDVDAGAEVAITTAKPGLYYSIEAANSVDFTTDKVEGARELATTTTVSPAKPAKTGTAVFYRVKVSATPNTNN